MESVREKKQRAKGNMTGWCGIEGRDPEPKTVFLNHSGVIRAWTRVNYSRWQTKNDEHVKSFFSIIFCALSMNHIHQH